MPFDDAWLRMVASCNKAVKILRARGYKDEPYLDEGRAPVNWDELRRKHDELWSRVYGRSKLPMEISRDVVQALEDQKKDEKKACSLYHEIAGKLSHHGQDEAARKISEIANDECSHEATLSDILGDIEKKKKIPEYHGLYSSIASAYYTITDPGHTVFHMGDIVSGEALMDENARVIQLAQMPAMGRRNI